MKDKDKLRIINYGIIKIASAKQFLELTDRIKDKIQDGEMTIHDPVILSSNHKRQGSFPETTDFEAWCRPGQTMRVVRLPIIEMNTHERLKNKLLVEFNFYHEK